MFNAKLMFLNFQLVFLGLKKGIIQTRREKLYSFCIVLGPMGPKYRVFGKLPHFWNVLGVSVDYAVIF